MSGIVGCWLNNPQKFHQAARDIGFAMDSLRHRGPDDCGLWHNSARTVILGHQRLAVIDVTAGGHQPMQFLQEQGEEELLVAANGAIDNFRNLQQDLEQHGYEFYSDSDTEVLLAAYAHYGSDLVDHLRGMFAFVIWDGRNRSILLARDRAGKKPLYYTQNETGLFFASELNALRKLVARESLEIDREALDCYLRFGAIVGRRTIYQSVLELPPATVAIGNSPRNLAEHQYWQPNWTPQRNLRLRDAVEETDRILRESVRLRLRTEVPTGVLISGGIESALIAALAAEESGEQVTTLSIGVGRLTSNERALADEVTAGLDTDHQEMLVQPQLADILPLLARQFGEPFADASAVAAHAISEAVAYHTTVILTGDGGDELFCGHPRYLAARSAERKRRWLGWAFGSKFASILLALSPRPQSKRGRYARYHHLLRCLTATGIDRTLLHLGDGFSSAERQSLFINEFVPLAISDLLGEEMSAAGELHPLDMMQRFDFEVFLPDRRLRMVDTTSMAYSVEQRSPLLDDAMVGWANSLPLSLKLRGGQTKSILRAVARRYLPKNAVNAVNVEQELPLEQWLGGTLKEMRDDLILSRSGLLGQLFERDMLENLLSPRGRRQVSAARWSQLVWTLLMLALWDQECWSTGQAKTPTQPNLAA